MTSITASDTHGGAQASSEAGTDQGKPLTGATLWIAAFAIGMANFLAVLDTTIANVSVPTIAGSIGISSTQGTWVITSYAVAEAITVPLTGWLSKTFGAKRTFLTCFLAFGVLSILCGLAHSLGMLILARVLLGLAGGPLIPLSLMLLLRIFPKEQATTATTVWAMTSLIGPIVGPVLGGVICDTIGWSWIFFINVPIAAAGGAIAWALLRGHSDTTETAKIDRVGLALLIVWVAALQIMIDEGRNHDWFASGEIRLLAAIAVAGFAAFVIWELTVEDPIIDLRVFRHRGFAAAVATYSIGFGAFFGLMVLLPLWLQQNMGYTATWAGYATATMGILAMASAPFVGKLAQRFDPRLIVSIGITGLALTTMWRIGFNSEVTFLQMALPTLLAGTFMVMFFVPVTGLALASVNPDETASASGLSNFARTLAGALATALTQTYWNNATRVNQTELAGAMTQGNRVIDDAIAGGTQRDAAVAGLTGIVEQQSVMLATLNTFGVLTLVFLLSAALIWIAPKPRGPIDVSASH